MFWQIYLPADWNSSSSSAAKQNLGGSWLDIIQNVVPDEMLPLHKATLAMSLNTVGRRDGQSHIIEEGVNLYSDAMRASASALARPKQSDRPDALLAATRLFSLYEVCLVLHRLLFQCRCTKLATKVEGKLEGSAADFGRVSRRR